MSKERLGMSAALSWEQESIYERDDGNAGEASLSVSVWRAARIKNNTEEHDW